MYWWLIYKKEDLPGNANPIRYYKRACVKRNITLKLIIYEEFSIVAGKDGILYRDGNDYLERPDAVINRTRDAEFARLLEEQGIFVCNSSYLTRIGNDKFAALQFAAALKIPVMETECIFDDKPSLYDFPCVVKSVSGHGGTEVFMVHSEEEYTAAVSKIRERTQEKILVQKSATDLGKDLRIYMIGGRPAAAMLRISETDFRSNFCLGGRCEVHELTQEEREIAEKIAAACRIDYCGIDLIYDNGHPVFNEIEDAVGARMIYINTDLDILDRYVEYIREQCK